MHYAFASLDAVDAALSVEFTTTTTNDNHHHHHHQVNRSKPTVPTTVLSTVKSSSYPLFLKCCHLTQASMHSVQRLPSAEWLDSHADEVRRWATDKWKARADDAWRSAEWRANGNALTNSLVPGFLLQQASSISRLDENGEVAVFEVEARPQPGLLLVCKQPLPKP